MLSATHRIQRRENDLEMVVGGPPLLGIARQSSALLAFFGKISF
jgi:hypothetical protein